MLLARLAAEQDVRRLDVAVDEPLLVRGVERARDLLEDPDGIDGLEAAARAEQRVQVGARHVAHRDVEVAVLLLGLVHGHDVGMVDPRGEARLALEALAKLGVLRELGGDELDRDLTAERELRRAEHDAHAAASDALLEPVVADCRSDVEHASALYAQAPRGRA